MTESWFLAEGYGERMLAARYWLTGEQLLKISNVVRGATPSLLDCFEVCDLLKLIEYDQHIEEGAEEKMNDFLPLRDTLGWMRLWLICCIFDRPMKLSTFLRENGWEQGNWWIWRR